MKTKNKTITPRNSAKKKMLKIYADLQMASIIQGQFQRRLYEMTKKGTPNEIELLNEFAMVGHFISKALEKSEGALT